MGAEVPGPRALAGTERASSMVLPNVSAQDPRMSAGVLPPTWCRRTRSQPASLRARVDEGKLGPVPRGRLLAETAISIRSGRSRCRSVQARIEHVQCGRFGSTGTQRGDGPNRARSGRGQVASIRASSSAKRSIVVSYEPMLTSITRAGVRQGSRLRRFRRGSQKGSHPPQIPGLDQIAGGLSGTDGIRHRGSVLLHGRTQMTRNSPPPWAEASQWQAGRHGLRPESVQFFGTRAWSNCAGAIDGHPFRARSALGGTAP